MGRATTRAALHPVAPRARDAIRCLLSIGVAASAFAWLVPPAVVGAPAATTAALPSVSLVGSLSTVGLPSTPAVSRLLVRNDGAEAIRWSITAEVVGEAAPNVTVRVWVSDDGSCVPSPATILGTGWSRDALPAGAALPICVRVSSDGRATGSAQPRVSVSATAV